MRIAPIVLAGLLTVSACGSDSTVRSPSPLDPAERGRMVTQAIDMACPECESAPHLYVRSQLIEAATLVGDEEPMPAGVADAIADHLPGIRFVVAAEEAAIFGEEGVVDGALVYVGPVRELAPGVAGISVGVVTALDGARFEIVQFAWNGDTWERTTSEESGVTVTSAVS